MRLRDLGFREHSLSLSRHELTSRRGTECITQGFLPPLCAAVALLTHVHDHVLLLPVS